MLTRDQLDEFERNGFPNAARFVQHNLKQGRLMLLFDGFDEVNQQERPGIVTKIEHFLQTYRGCRAAITCRTAVYKNEFQQITDQKLEILEFTDQQIRQFLLSWEKDMPEDKSIEQLMQTLHDRPRIMAMARRRSAIEL